MFMYGQDMQKVKSKMLEKNWKHYLSIPLLVPMFAIDAQLVFFFVSPKMMAQISNDK